MSFSYCVSCFGPVPPFQCLSYSTLSLGYNVCMSPFIIFGPVFDKDYLFPFSSFFVREEVCVVFGLRYGPYVYFSSLAKIRNTHPDPERSFQILNKDVKELEQSYREGRIIGYIHTHSPISPKPSTIDRKGLPEGMIGGVWCEGKLTLYTNKGIRPFRLLP